jgi:hypothetical protein
MSHRTGVQGFHRMQYIHYTHNTWKSDIMNTSTYIGFDFLLNMHARYSNRR